MNIYYNDNFISINAYALIHKKTVPYLLRRYNKGEIKGDIIGGIRFVAVDDPSKRWYHYNLENEKIYLPDKPKVLTLGAFITVQAYGRRINRLGDVVYDQILIRKMQCCVISGIVFVDGRTDTHKELIEIAAKAGRIRVRRN